MSDAKNQVEVPLNTRFLLVDDSPTMMDEMVKILSLLGFKDISKASDGVGGWNQLLQSAGTMTAFEVILCDWNMPGSISGVQLLEKVRNSPHGKMTIFILVTTENSFEKVKKAIQLGVSDYILKPFTVESVVQKLNSTWKRRKLPDPPSS